MNRVSHGAPDHDLTSEALAEVERALLAELDATRFFNLLVESASRLFGAYTSVWLVAEEGLLVEHLSSVPHDFPAEPVLVDESSMTWQCLVTRRGLLVNDYPQSPHALSRYVAAGIRHAMAQPLWMGDRLLGTLVMSRTGADAVPFTEPELTGLERLASLAALALRNATLYEESERRRRAAEELARVARLVVLDEAEVGSQIATSLVALFGCVAARLRLARPDGSLALVASAGPHAGDVGEVLAPGIGLAGRALSEGRLYWSRDILDDPRIVLDAERRRYVETLGHAAALVAPLRYHERVGGVLGMVFRERRSFSEDECALAQAFADQAAVALQNARMYAETERRRRESEALARAARTLAETVDVRAAAQRVVEDLLPLLRTRSASLRCLRPDGGLELVAAAGRSRAALAPGHVMLPGEAGPAWAVARGAPVTSRDLLGEPATILGDAFRRWLVEGGDRAMAAVPVRGRSGVLGCLSVGDATGREFSETDVALLQTFADEIAVALEKARLYEEAERRRREAEALAAVASALTEIQDVDAVASRIVEAVVTLVRGCVGAVVSARRPDGARIVLASHGPLSEVFKPGQVLPVEGPIGHLGREEHTLWFDEPPTAGGETGQPELAARQRELLAAGIRAAVGIPLVARGKVIGVLAMGFGERPSLSDEEIALNRALADHAALALESARLYQEADRRRREVEVMAEIAQTISAALDVDTVLQRMAEGARTLCKSDLARIALRDADTGDVVVRYAVNTRYRGYASAPLRPDTRSLGGLVLLTGRPVRTNNWMTDPRFDPEGGVVIRAEGIVAQMGVPIRIGYRVEGVLYVDNRAPRPFTDLDEAALQQLAEQAAIAIRNAQLFATVQRTSERLQVLSARLLEVQEAERRHIARELHDEVGQALTAVRINLQLLKRVPALDASATRIDESLGIVERILAAVRQLSLDLHPSTLDDLGLVVALRSHVNALAERADLAARVSIDPLAQEPAPGLAATCFRVAQEALTNAVRHARATRLEVELRGHPGELELIVRDDGIGFDVPAARRQALRGGSLGLLGLEERVGLAGGQVTISSSSLGTEIRARFPLPAPPAD